MKKILSIIIFLAASTLAWYFNENGTTVFDGPSVSTNGQYTDFASAVSGEQVSGSGVVVRVLSDDNEGSRHQRFILKLGSERTILVAHNIDVAPRIASIRVGDNVKFYGEFERNDQGGVIHWTHRDSQNRHAHGWLRHKDKTYE